MSFLDRDVHFRVRPVLDVEQQLDLLYYSLLDFLTESFKLKYDSFGLKSDDFIKIEIDGILRPLFNVFARTEFGERDLVDFSREELTSENAHKVIEKMLAQEIAPKSWINSFLLPTINEKIRTNPLFITTLEVKENLNNLSV